MVFEEMLKDEYSAGKADGLTEGLAKGKAEGKTEAFRLSISNFLTDIAPVSGDLKNRISSIEDLDVLTALNKKAARAKSIEEFENQLTQMKY